MFDVAGQTVLVTGGTRGIGKGIAEAFLKAGARVFSCGRRAPGEPAGGGPGQKPAVEFIQADVRDEKSARLLLDELLARTGRLDTLVNNAGGAPPAEAATASPGFTEAVIRLNLLAPLLMSRLARAALRESRGSIINIASVSGVRASPGSMAYGAAKAGLLNATLSLAQEWAPDIRVNAVVAGLIETEAADAHYGGAAGRARLAARLPGGRLGRPDDLAGACIYLASPAAAYVSGATLEVTGGGETPGFLTFIEDAGGRG